MSVPASGAPRVGIPFRAVFEFLPSGIVVCDAKGAVLGTNLSAKRLLRGLLAGEDQRCCDLFGCGQAGTPLAGRCITDLALEATSPLPELRTDLPAPGTGAVWLTGAPFGGAEPWVVITMRAGRADDRRATETAGPRLRVFTLGRTRLETEDGPVAAEWLGHRPGRIFKYLVAERDRVVPADELVEVFWPDAGRKGLTSVRQAVVTLRDRLEPDRSRHTATSFVLARSGGYELELGEIWIDADDFEACVAEGVKAVAQGERETALAAFTRAVDLYRGDFLGEEPYAEWAFGERDRYRDLAAQALRGLADLQQRAGDFEAAAQGLHRLAELEPLDLDAQRELLALLVRRGRHPDAARRYEVVRRRWERTFGESLPFELGDLRRDA